MKKLELIIDLSEAINKKQVIDKFVKFLGLPPSSIGNWDAFEDMMGSLHTESSVVVNKKPQSVHLILKNIKDLKNNSYEDYRMLLEILSEETDKKQRYDKLAFTFEIAND